MSDIGSTQPVKKPPTPFQRKVRRLAKQKAAAAGLDWKTMAKEDRVKMRKEVREALKAKNQQRKLRKAQSET